jgi:hypothetical protein
MRKSLDGLTHIQNLGGNYLVFKTRDGSTAAVNLLKDFEDRPVTKDILKQWVSEQTEEKQEQRAA